MWLVRLLCVTLYGQKYSEHHTYMCLQKISFKLPALIPPFVGFPSFHSAGLGFHQVLEHGRGESLPFRHKHQLSQTLMLGLFLAFQKCSVGFKSGLLCRNEVLPWALHKLLQ